MAGTLFGVPLSQQIGPDGRAASGALVYVYEANTSTPANTYADFGLTSLNAWPLEADSTGRVPSFYVDDGSYRLRITTAAGVELVDEQAITAIGASSGGDSGSVSQDTENIFQTGDVLWLPVSGTRSGWVRGNGRTIGNGASGGTERASGDTEALFAYFWNNFSDSFCAVSGGRGASATADFNAAKTIATLDMRSKAIFGLDDMGNTSAGVTGASTVAATAVGASTYTIATANLPSTTLSHSLSVNTAISGDGDLVTAVNTDDGTENLATGGSQGRVNTVDVVKASTLTLTSGTVSGTVSLGGSGTHLAILTPSRAGTFYFKL